jgi:hypothetical protein
LLVLFGFLKKEEVLEKCLEDWSPCWFVVLVVVDESGDVRD